jgi:transcriptional regulator with XRE-family HTH domain
MKRASGKKRHEDAYTGIGAALKTARERQHRTVTEVASAAGITQEALSKIEGGDRDPRLANAASLCKALGLSLDELLGLRPKDARSHELLDVRRTLRDLLDRLDRD